MTSISLKNISHVYKNEYIEEKVLEDINLDLEEGKMYCLIGPSGSGKSTLLNIMGGLLKPTKGNVLIANEDITGFSEKELADLRITRIGYIFQNYNLIPFLNVRDNILLQLRIAKRDISQSMGKYRELIEKLELTNKENVYVNQLSGGQQQRVAIARCLIMEPSIILADEPTGNLDFENTQKFIKLVQSIMEDVNSTFIIVTHDERLCKYCDTTIRIEDHKIELTPGMGKY